MHTQAGHWLQECQRQVQSVTSEVGRLSGHCQSLHESQRWGARFYCSPWPQRWAWVSLQQPPSCEQWNSLPTPCWEPVQFDTAEGPTTWCQLPWESAWRPQASNFQQYFLYKTTNLTVSRQAAQSHMNFTDTKKYSTGCIISLQRDKIQFHPPEYRYQSLPPENSRKAMVKPHPPGKDSTNKSNYNFTVCRKETPKTVKKMEGQRNMHQLEHGKNLQDK